MARHRISHRRYLALLGLLFVALWVALGSPTVSRFGPPLREVTLGLMLIVEVRSLLGSNRAIPKALRFDAPDWLLAYKRVTLGWQDRLRSLDAVAERTGARPKLKRHFEESWLAEWRSTGLQSLRERREAPSGRRRPPALWLRPQNEECALGP